MPTHQPLNGLSGNLQSRESWTRQQALEFIRHTFARAMASLTPSQQRDYVRLQRAAHTALDAVELHNASLISQFKSGGLLQLSRRIGNQDPEQIFLHTRYLEKVEPPLPWEPRTGNAELKPRERRFRRAYDDWNYRPHVSRLSLWDAACLNFDFATDTPQPSGHSFVQASYLTGASGLSVAEFVAISRELDLGEQLQKALSAALSTNGKLATLLHASTRACLLFEVLEAYRNRAITGVTQALFDTLTRAIDGRGPALKFETLGMTTGITVLPAVPFAPADTPVPVPLMLIKVASLGVLSYFPFRPGGALRYHTDANRAGQDFAQQLKNSHAAKDLGWFARQLPTTDMHAFKRLGKSETRPTGLSPVAGWLYDTFHRWFPGQALNSVRFTTDTKHGRAETLVQALTYRHIQRYQANLATLATSRSERDLQAVTDGAASIAQEILQLLLTPMPGGVSGLNRIMQVAVFGSLTYSVITGVNEAARGDASQFAGALADIADMAVNGLLISTAGRVHRQRIDGLLQKTGNPHKVTGSDGTARLWRPDIGPHPTLDPNLLNGHTANAQGIYEIHDKQYAQVKHAAQRRVMEVSYDARAMRFTLKAQSPAHFAAPITFNPAYQAWMLDLNDTHTLSDTQLTARMLPENPSSIPDADIERMLRSVSPSRDTLDAIWAGQQTPISLAEGVRRLQVDHLLARLSIDFQRRGNMPLHAERPVLSLLTQLPGWPVNAQIRLHDAQGRHTHTYAAARAPANGVYAVNLMHRADGTYGALNDPANTATSRESLFESILRQLPAGSTLGKEGSPDLTETQRIARLRLQISQRVQSDKAALFSALTRYAEHARHEVPAVEPARQFAPLYLLAPPVAVTPLVQKLRMLYPPLTPAHLEHLLEQKPLRPEQRADFLKGAMLPAALHEHLEAHRTALRIDAAIDGLYHPRAFNPDADQWAREFASNLLGIRLHRHFVVTEMASGEAVDRYVSSGPDDATVELLHYGQGRYEAYDLRNGGPIPVSPPGDSFYLAIGSVLQPHERLGLGMNSPVDAQGLRTTLGDLMSAQRSRTGYVSLLDRSLGQYEVKQRLPTGQQPDAQGLYEHDGQWLLPLGGAMYAITFDRQQLKWRLKHPDKVGVDTPLLEHNRHGAWRLANDNPMRWSDHQLFSRLGHGDYNVEQATADQILNLTDTPPRTLRQVHSSSLPPPPLLQDTSKRFRIERDILQFIQAMTTYSGNSVARPSLQLLLVTALPDWPKTHLLEIVDSNGQVIHQSPPPSDTRNQKVRLTQEQSRGPEPLKNIVLNDTLTSALLGEQPATRDERLFKLAKKIAEHAYRERAQLFDSLYRQSERGGNPLEQRLKAHSPALPDSAVKAILTHASPKEIRQLQQHGQVSLRLKEQARLTADDVRLNRAFEGLYLNTPSNPDSEKIILHLLESVPGWPANVRVDIHDTTPQRRLLQSTGHLNGSDRRTLTRLDGGYQAYDAQGRLLNEPGSTTHDLLSALTLLLTRSERTALGIVDGIDTTPLQQRIADRALNQRVSIKALLGLQHIAPWLQPPMGVDHSLTAYPFTLRNLWPPGGDSLPAVDLVSKLRELYPSLSRGQASYLLDSMGLTPPAALLELERRRAEYQALDYGLTQWAEAPHPNDEGDPLGLNLGQRRYITGQIRSAWRRETRARPGGSMRDLYCLHLQLGSNDLPDPDFILGTRGFEHIESLSIRADAFAPTGADFLSKFSGLMHLDLDCNLTQLPTSLTDMRGLRMLQLSGNQIVLTQESRQRLAGMTDLRRLLLDDNPLGLTPDVSAMPLLYELDLTATGIDQWPIGAERLTGLASLALAENRITTIPDALFSDERMQPANQSTVLHDNPLSSDTLTRLTEYRNSTGIRLGGNLPGIVHVPDTNADADHWLTGVPPGQRNARRLLWEQLLQHEGASPDDAFRVLRDLTQSYAYTHNASSRQALTDRVWRLLDAMGESTELRETVFLNTYVAGTCGDGALLVFINMEIAHKVYQAKCQAGSEQADRQLLELATGLFYLRQLDLHAEAHIETLHESGAEPDDAEIKLYYRLRLRKALKLPVQDEEMLYSVEDWVSERDIALAQRKLEDMNRTQAPQSSLLTEAFWVDYLSRRFPERFNDIETTARQQIDSLNREVADRRSDRYLEKRQSIVDMENAERDRLIRQLTEAAQRTH